MPRIEKEQPRQNLRPPDLGNVRGRVHQEELFLQYRRSGGEVALGRHTRSDQPVVDTPGLLDVEGVPNTRLEHVVDVLAPIEKPARRLPFSHHDPHRINDCARARATAASEQPTSLSQA
jgi:hypothetical protein